MPVGLNTQTGATTPKVPSELAHIVASVFETMMDLKTEEIGIAWFSGTGRLTAAVHLAGDWNGAILLECDGPQACRLASRFLSMDPPATVDDVVRDVLGEVASMIGGNLKYVLKGEARLSMPSIVDGSDYSVRYCGATLRERLAFRSAEGIFWISVLATRR